MTSPAEASTAADAHREWPAPYPLDLAGIVGPLARGASDPTYRRQPSGDIWRTTRLASGVTAYRLRQLSSTTVICDAWGAGAGECVDTLPALLGAHDRPEEFDPRLPIIAEAHRRHPGLRMVRTGRVLEALMPAVLEQRVLTVEAQASWRRLLIAHGETPPGPAPAGMRVPPSAAAWRAIPSWRWHQAGVDPGRARTALACATVSERLEHCTDLSAADAWRRLTAVPGVGRWTAAQVAQRAWGDADAVSVGDYHLAKDVGRAMTGRPVDDDEMLVLLAPWSGHRYRFLRLLATTSAWSRQRFGPRMPRQDQRSH